MAPQEITTEAHSHVFEHWKQYSQGERQDVCLSFTKILRQSYPDHHVVRVKPSNCDLQGFADAGLADWKDERLDGQYDATRKLSSRDLRSETTPVKLADDIQFGMARYAWEDRHFVLYRILFKEGLPFMPPQEYLFLLAPDGGKVVDGSHPDIDALILACGRWTKELHGEILVFDNAAWHKSKSLYESVQSASWEDVILNEATKAKFIDDVQGFFDNQELYKSFGVPWKRGVILHGVPGNGKTISIKALINTVSKRQPNPIPSLYVKSFDNCNGGPKASLEMIFKKARHMAPCALIFEDLDSMVTDKVRSYFLNEVDGIQSNEGILMIGSTNHLDALDPAIAKRPSRFDRKYHFKVPGEHERTLYGQYWHRKLAGNPHVTFPEELCPIIAKWTEEFSFAYLKELFVTSLLLLARGDPLEDLSGGPASDDSSTTDVVVVETPQEGAVSSARKETSDRDKAKAPKPRKIIPTVEVPEGLQDNLLLAIIKAQAQVLLDEMDNSSNEPVKKKESCCE